MPKTVTLVLEVEDARAVLTALYVADDAPDDAMRDRIDSVTERLETELKSVES